MPKLMRAAHAALVVVSVLAACARTAQAQAPQPPAARPVAAAVPQLPSIEPAARISGTPAAAAGPAPERWEAITVQTANAGPYRLPVGAGHAGPSVLHVQVLLNRAFFSPGMLDGRWGRNTQNAVAWFQAREGLPTTGAVDSATYARLVKTAGDGPTLREHVLTEEDVRGPFVEIPADIYAHARLRCSCYESLSEKLTETFQTGLTLLRRLNPGVNLDSVTAGTVLNVPRVRDPAVAPAAMVRQIVVSGTGKYLQALDAGGRILYHFAATLGSTIDPSPDGDFRVTSIHQNPWWNYQPKLLAHVPDDRPNALIPPGPNNAVGRVWMSLSAPHYGIHGTKSPETIGYAQSAGCVRLTNWDVVFLSTRVPAGTPVSFRDTRQGARPATPAQQPAVPVVLPDTARRDSAAAAAPDTTRRTPAAGAHPDSARRDPAPAAGPDTVRGPAPPADTLRMRPAPAPPRPAAPAPAPADTASSRPRG